MEYYNDNTSSVPISVEEPSTTNRTSATTEIVTSSNRRAGDDSRYHHNQHQSYYRLPVTYTCMEPCVKCRDNGAPAARHCVHLVFLASFVLFLIVGVALTCLGFLDYGAGGANSKAFRILGIVALLLCIGFLIAACGKDALVIVYTVILMKLYVH